MATLILCPGSAGLAEGGAESKAAKEAFAVVPFEGMLSRPSGDVRLGPGFGGGFGVGARVGRITARIVFGSSFHRIKDGGHLVLGDSVTVASDWEISWIGVDGQYALRDRHRGWPFVSLGISGAFLTRGENDNVKGWRLSGGVGYEYSLHHIVSLSVQAQVDQLRFNTGKAAGQPIKLTDPFDETVLSLKVGVNLFQRI